MQLFVMKMCCVREAGDGGGVDFEPVKSSVPWWREGKKRSNV